VYDADPEQDHGGHDDYDDPTKYSHDGCTLAEHFNRPLNRFKLSSS